MKSTIFQRIGPHLRDAEGKGALGCLFTLVLIAVAAFLTVAMGPPYYAYKNLEHEVKNEASRAGANFSDDETVINNVIDLARRNEIQLKPENIKLERFAGKLTIKVHYTVPVNLIVTDHTMVFDIQAKSLVGRL